MKLHTAAETISFARELEERSARFYEGLSERYPEDGEALRSFARENKKFVTQIQRAYYSVITDAIEGCFAFDIDADAYRIAADLPVEASYSKALTRALEMEEQIGAFYTTAAEQSMSLMADVPRNFKIVAKKRHNRISQLKAFAERFREKGSRP
jgi:hypothetical protein